MVGTAATSGARASWGTPPISASGAHSASTSGSAGSPPEPTQSAAPAAAMTPASESTFVRLNNLDIHTDEAAASSQAAARLPFPPHIFSFLDPFVPFHVSVSFIFIEIDLW